MNYWIAKAKPSENVEFFRKDLRKGRRGWWRTQKPPKVLAVGDRLVIWKASPGLQVVGLAEVTKVPIKHKPGEEARFDVRYSSDLFGRPVEIGDLKREKDLRGASFLRPGPSGTFFPLLQIQAACIIRLAKASNPEIRSLWGPLKTGRDLRTAMFTPVEPTRVPARVQAKILRVIRDTQAARDLKDLYGHKCQVCKKRIELIPKAFYSEVHHIRPLGGEHCGKDWRGNMLVICPNHHTFFDFGIPRFISATKVEIQGKAYRLLLRHQISVGAVTYHNREIWEGGD